MRGTYDYFNINNSTKMGAKSMPILNNKVERDRLIKFSFTYFSSQKTAIEEIQKVV